MQVGVPGLGFRVLGLSCGAQDLLYRMPFHGDSRDSLRVGIY